MRIWAVKLRSLRRRSTAEKLLLLQSVLLLTAVRAALWCWPFARVQGLLARGSKARRVFGNRTQLPQSVTWAVQTAARYVPGSNCLTQALVTRLVLARHGHTAHLRFEMAQNDTGELVVHACVESSATTVAGGKPDMQRQGNGSI